MEEEECIYNLIPKPAPVIKKPPLHVSSYANSHEFETVQKRQHGTMGLTKESLKRDPHNFVKKHSGTKELPPRASVQPHGNATLSKPPVPRHDQTKRLTTNTKRNFVLENWKAAPKTKQLHPQVQETFWTEKKDYGKVPKYLNRVKKESQAEAEYWENVRQSMMPEDTETRCRLLPEEERLEILAGLKANLADVKKRYAALSFGQDNLSFRKTKEGMEAEMEQLEKDIATFSRSNVYVSES